MPSTTSGGLPIPLDADPIADGALALRNLAGKLDAPGVGWSNVTFANGWVNFGGLYSNVQYKRVGQRVHLRGLMKSGTVGAFNAFVLPAGHRPPGTLMFAPPTSTGAGRLEIDSAGQVQLISGGNGWCGLNLSFERA